MNMKVDRWLFFPLYTIFSVLFCLVVYHCLVPELREGGRFDGSGRTVFTIDGAEGFALLLDEYESSLLEVRESADVKSLYPENLPHDLHALPIPEKTSIFISLVLPSVLRVNAEIAETRNEVVRLITKKENFQRLTAKEEWWLNRVARSYGCRPDDTTQLMMRVDEVPPALALAQAITESGWGTSRFAREGNALYGLHMPSKSDGNYIVSRKGNVKVAAFDSVYEATRSYMHSLNRVYAYSEFRAQRAAMREKGQTVTGHDLAVNLYSYSELGDRYIRDLQFLIKQYQLEELNKTVLLPEKRENRVRFSR
ncbi:glucosaminidase domain-containing protein [Desulfosediminicola sp.]|uniref:glucosaminidase domain-containing protein n=1 Tax=Desulfosediminicola sp. TaxID=2886825 RepID=UPI003AF2FCF5